MAPPRRLSRLTQLSRLIRLAQLSGPARRAVRLITGAAALGYCWVAAGLRPFTEPMGVAVAVPIAVVAGLAWHRRPLPAGGAPTWTEAAPWIALASVLAVVETVAYLSFPRSEHPTLSSIADAAMGSHPGRAAMFGLWLAFGWAVVARRRLGRSA